MSDDRPPSFDAVRACFYLVAFVIVVHCAIALAGSVFCLIEWNTLPALPDGRRCDPANRLADLLAGALAAALAFAGGFKGGKGDRS